MHRVDAARQPAVRRHRQALRLHLGEDRIGGHHANGGVGAGQQRLRPFAAQQRAPGVEQRAPVRRARPGHHLRGVGVQHIAHRVAGNQGAHGDAVRRHRRRAHAALHGAGDAKQLAHAGAGARAHIAFGRVGARRRGAGCVTRCRIGPDAHVAHQQVKQHRRRHQRQPAHAHVQPHAVLFQPAHRAAGGVQSPGAAAGQHDGMHLVHQIARVQQIGFPRARRCATHIDTAHCAIACDDHRAARGAARVGEMANLDAGHAGDAASVAGRSVWIHGWDCAGGMQVLGLRFIVGDWEKLLVRRAAD